MSRILPRIAYLKTSESHPPSPQKTKLGGGHTIFFVEISNLKVSFFVAFLPFLGLCFHKNVLIFISKPSIKNLVDRSSQIQSLSSRIKTCDPPIIIKLGKMIFFSGRKTSFFSLWNGVARQKYQLQVLQYLTHHRRLSLMGGGGTGSDVSRRRREHF